MYLKAGSNYYLIPFVNRVVYTKSGLIIKNPNFKVRLLSISELSKVEILKQSKVDEAVIYEQIYDICFLGLMGFDSEEFLKDDLAFIVTEIGRLVYNKTISITTDMPKEFNNCLEEITSVEVWSGYISNILNMNYKDIITKGIDEIIKLYAIAYVCSNKTIPPIALAESNVNSKIG